MLFFIELGGENYFDKKFEWVLINFSKNSTIKLNGFQEILQYSLPQNFTHETLFLIRLIPSCDNEITTRIEALISLLNFLPLAHIFFFIKFQNQKKNKFLIGFKSHVKENINWNQANKSKKRTQRFRFGFPRSIRFSYHRNHWIS